MTSCSCSGTMPPVHAGAAPAAAPPAHQLLTASDRRPPWACSATLPSGTMASGVPAPPVPPLYPRPEFAPSAAAINCNNFCGSFSHCLNSGPSVWAAICAAMLTSPVSGIGGHKLHFIDLDRATVLLAPPSASLICLATSVRFRSGDGKGAHQANEVFLGDVFGEVQAGQSGRRSAAWRSCFSAFPVSSGMPSSSSLLSETPSRKPLIAAVGSPCCSSFHAISNCASVRLCS